MPCVTALRRWGLIIGLFGVLLAIPPQSANADNAPRYDGKIQSLDSPVLLRYQAIGHYQQTCTIVLTAVAESKQQTATMSTTMEGSSHQSEAGLVWDLSSRVDLDSTDPSKVGTITKGSTVSDDRGRILDIEYATPNVPRDIMLELVAKLNFLLPAKPVSVGDNLTASSVSIDLTPMIKKIAGDRGNKKIPELNLDFDLDSIVAGQTIIAGRRYLVVNVDGEGGLSVNDQRIDIDMRGYVFLDVATAIMSHSALHMEAAGSFEGKHAKFSLDFASATSWE